MGKGPLEFKVLCTYKHARCTEVKLYHSVVSTPVYMPVGTQGTLKGFTTEQIQNLSPDPKIMLSNTYFLNQRPGTEVLDAVGGLHNFMGWDRSYLTDSGGFQMVSLIKLSSVTEEGVEFISPIDGSKLLLTPEESVRTQQSIGSDIIMMLDDVVSAQLDPKIPKEKARIEEASLRTTRWLDRCIKAHTNHKTQTLYCICQGHLDNSPGGTRDQCIRDITERALRGEVGGIAIGGLSGGEAKEDFWKTVLHCCMDLPQQFPRYLMGVGFPLDLVVCSCLGVDQFDCVYSTRTARMGTALTNTGAYSLQKGDWLRDERPVMPGCTCECCKYPRAYLSALFKEGSPVAGQLLSIHNVTYLLTLMAGIREAIKTQTLDLFVENFLKGYYPDGKKDVPQWVIDALTAVDIVINEW